MQAVSPECSREAGRPGTRGGGIAGDGAPGAGPAPSPEGVDQGPVPAGQLQRLDLGEADIFTSSPERAGATGWISLSDSHSDERAPQAQATH